MTAIKKDYLDFLYQMKAELQTEIDLQVQKNKEPESYCCDRSKNGVSSGVIRLRQLREHIKTVNDSIQKYISVHSNSI